MTININGHALSTDSFDGDIVVSDTSEAGTNSVKNIVVLTQAAYNALGTKDSNTLYFIT